MKKTIRLTESDLTRLVRRIIEESFTDAVPAPNELKNELLTQFKEIIERNLKRDGIKHWKISPAYNILADYCKENRIPKQDVIDFIDYEVKGRREKESPILKKDQGFIDAVNRAVMKYQSSYNHI